MKYVLFQDLPKEVAVMRQNKQTIVLTSGVFDLLNLGHLFYLEDAAQLADCLIVGIDSNELVRKFKGPKRPYNDQEARALLVAGLRPVKLVTIFFEMTSLIEVVKPDVFIITSEPSSLPDHRPELINSLGGRVEVIPSRHSVHSSDIIEEIKKNA